MNPLEKSILLPLFVLSGFLSIITAPAQEKKAAPTPQPLFEEIKQLDSIVFHAFNTQDMEKFRSLFTEDLEWFQDNGGLLSYATVFETFGKSFKQENKLSRELVNGSLEVHPVKDYGAIETGMHKFRHMENGKEITGTFKFLMIWQKKDGQWRISRVVSYDH